MKSLKHAAAAVIIGMCSVTAWAAPSGKRFDSPEKAAEALATAARASDADALLEVLGRDSKRIISSGDKVADAAARARFLEAFDAAHAIETRSAEESVLTVGQDRVPFPIPIVKVGEAWAFDAAAGQEEIIARRIGSNELAAIESLRAYVEAQQAYAQLSGTGAYAQRIISRRGKKDGLYWPAQEGEEESPLGPLIGGARTQGYAMQGGKPAPYRGYTFRILKRQGKSAPGGARSFVAGKRMIGGFAMIAAPAKYGTSGVMTFIVSHDGEVFQRDLGPDTVRKAAAVSAYDPGPEWSKVDER